MPYVEGGCLRDRLVRQGELPVHEAVNLFCEVVDALTNAHGSWTGILSRSRRRQAADAITIGPGSADRHGRRLRAL